MSTRSGSKVLLILQSSSSSFWCIVMVVWLFGLSRFVIVVFSDHTHYFWQNVEPNLDPNCSSLYPVSTYYIRNQATVVSLAGRYWPVMGCWLDIAWSGYDDKIVCGKKKESAYITFIVCFWKHFKMKMSEIDHTNSLDPDQAQQNVWQDPKEKGL